MPSRFFVVLFLFLSLSLPASSETVTGSAVGVSEARAVLGMHNQLRNEVEVKPLVWSTQLAGFAQEWADNLAESSCSLRHREGMNHGENLFGGSAAHYSAVDASYNWAQEKRLYQGGILQEGNWQPSGHYTQMVWSHTRKVGCGQSVCGPRRIVVCNYSPAGNIIGMSAH